MEKTPLQQPKQEVRIDYFTEEAKRSFSRIFDSKEVQKGIDDVIPVIERIPDSEVSNKEEVIKGLKESVEIKDKNTFINNVLKVIEPIRIFSLNNPKLFEEMQREHIVTKEENTKLSGVLFCGFDEERHSAHIHLTPAREFIKNFGVKAFINEVKDGLYVLAEMLKDKKDIKEVTATSWIVLEHPALMENLGFTIADKKLGLSSSPNDERKARDSYMYREDFLTKYSNKGSGKTD